MKKFGRRDFLKLMAISSAGVAASAAYPYMESLREQNLKKPNILIFVLDAMSARHLSLYGYQRETTPNLTRFASRANVYHSHYSTANFTSSGTATLLSGLHPWNHRAINLGGPIRRDLVDYNIFHLIGDEYYKVAYTQNTWADLLLRQYQKDLDIHLPVTSYSYKMKIPMVSSFFPSDQIMTYYAFDDFMSFSPKVFNPFSGSLMLGSLGLFQKQSTKELEEPSEEYPFGLPSNGLFYYYLNNDVFAGVTDIIRKLNNPSRSFFGYFHLFSPHYPYCPRKEFVGILKDIEVGSKPLHPLRIMELNPETLYELRKHYDEYIANVDSDFGKMMDIFTQTGISDNSYIVITSDHGQSFERGEFGHGTYLMYEPVIHIPLLISSPGQRESLDVFSPTSSTDILPTLLHLAGKDIPGGLNRRILPGLGGQEDHQRSIFAIDTKLNSAFEPLTEGTFTLIKEGKKLIYYTGYPWYPETFELYDLVDDIEETNDLFAKDPMTAARMKEELLDVLTTANHTFAEK